MCQLCVCARVCLCMRKFPVGCCCRLPVPANAIPQSTLMGYISARRFGHSNCNSPPTTAALYIHIYNIHNRESNPTQYTHTHTNTLLYTVCTHPPPPSFLFISSFNFFFFFVLVYHCYCYIASSSSSFWFTIQFSRNTMGCGGKKRFEFLSYKGEAGPTQRSSLGTKGRIRGGLLGLEKGNISHYKILLLFSPSLYCPANGPAAPLPLLRMISFYIL